MLRKYTLKKTNYHIHVRYCAPKSMPASHKLILIVYQKKMSNKLFYLVKVNIKKSSSYRKRIKLKYPDSKKYQKNIVWIHKKRITIMIIN